MVPRPGTRPDLRPGAAPPPAVAIAIAIAGAFGALLGAGAAGAQEPPADVAALHNPLADDAGAVARGQGLFLQNCAPCHGAAADGRGPAAQGLRPPPADLAGPDVVPGHSDGWLFFRLTNGKHGSAMPSFKGSLDEQERWSIIAWLRSLRPASGPTGPVR